MRNIQDWLNEEEASKLLEYHKATPHISIKEYWDYRTQALSATLVGKQKIYLDTCYWIYLRDAAMGRPKKSEHSEILNMLRKLVDSGAVVCPVSDMAFSELMRQADTISRLATTKLLDELSHSIALQFEQHRFRSELRAFLLDPTRPTKDSVSANIWTKASYIFGPKIPVIENIPEENQLILQKASIDLFWAGKFSDMAHLSMAELNLGTSFDRIADKINAKKNAYQHEIPSIERALVSEIAGIVDTYLDDADAILLEQYYCKNGGSVPTPSMEERQKARHDTRNCLINIFVYAREKAKYMLPSMYAQALQHGAFRMDSNRKFHGSFLRDIHHGTAGVVWHDAMLTEKSLKTLLTRSDVALDKTFGCEVLSKADEVISYLHKLS